MFYIDCDDDGFDENFSDVYGCEDNDNGYVTVVDNNDDIGDDG